MGQDEYAGVLQAAQQPQQPSAVAPKPAARLTTRAPLLTCQAAGLLQTSKPGATLCDTPAVVKPKPAAAQQQQAHKAVQQLTADQPQAVQGHAHAKPQGQAKTALQESHADAAGQQARVRKKRKTKVDQALQSEAFPLESQQRQLQQQQQQQQQQLNQQVHANVASVATQTDAGTVADTAKLLEGDPAQADDTGKVHRQAAQGGNTFPIVASPYLSRGRAVSLCLTAPQEASPTRAKAVQHQTPALEDCKEQDAELACGNQEKPDSDSLLAGRFLLEGLHVQTPSAHRPSQDKAAAGRFMAAEDSVPISQPVVLIDSTNTSQKQSKRKGKHALLGAATGKLTHCGSSA